MNLLELTREELLKNLHSGNLVIAVYGLGYVGLSLAAVWLRAGAKVIGVDINSQKVRLLNKGIVGSVEKAVNEAIKIGIKKSMFKAVEDGVEAARESHVKLITIPVWLNENKQPVLDAIESVSKTIAYGLKKGDLIILESSVPVGTTEEVVKLILEKISGLNAELDFGLAYSPERIYIGRAVEDIERNYPKIISGIGPKSLRAVSNLYSLVAKKGVIELPSIKHAEIEKLFEGVYRDVNIALANQLALLCKELGLDYDQVRRAANSQPFCHLHKPGAGVGGACIPLYSYFIQHLANKINLNLSLVEESRKINENMPHIVVDIIEEALKTLETEKVKIAILGLAFRGGIDDTRLSPSYEIIKMLKNRGFKLLVVHDPYVAKDDFLEQNNIKLTNDLAEAIEYSNVVAIVTDHPEYKSLTLTQLKNMSKREKLAIIDARHVIRDWRKVPKGVLYAGIGRSLICNLNSE